MDKLEETLHATIRTMGDQLTQLQTKFIFYLLAIVAACVGYGISFTKENALSNDDVVLLASFLSWFASFFCGIQSLRRMELIHLYNINFLGAYTAKPYRNIGENPLVNQPNPDRDRQSRLASLNRKWQIYLFFLGSLLFTMWYLIDKILQSGVYSCH